jgi:hypothetical protein
VEYLVRSLTVLLTLAGFIGTFASLLPGTSRKLIAALDYKPPPTVSSGLDRMAHGMLGGLDGGAVRLRSSDNRAISDRGAKPLTAVQKSSAFNDPIFTPKRSL